MPRRATPSSTTRPFPVCTWVTRTRTRAPRASASASAASSPGAEARGCATEGPARRPGSILDRPERRGGLTGATRPGSRQHGEQRAASAAVDLAELIEERHLAGRAQGVAPGENLEPADAPVELGRVAGAQL